MLDFAVGLLCDSQGKYSSHASLQQVERARVRTEKRKSRAFRRRCSAKKEKVLTGSCLFGGVMFVFASAGVRG